MVRQLRAWYPQIPYALVGRKSRTCRLPSRTAVRTRGVSGNGRGWGSAEEACGHHSICTRSLRTVSTIQRRCASTCRCSVAVLLNAILDVACALCRWAARRQTVRGGHGSLTELRCTTVVQINCGGMCLYVDAFSVECYFAKRKSSVFFWWGGDSKTSR